MRNLLLVLLALSIFACEPSTKKVERVDCCPKPAALQKSEVGYPDWSTDATIYEVNIRQYTPEGTFAAFEKHLPRLQELGVEILWLMPIHPISKEKRKGTLGSYYAVADYKAVNPEFGTMDDFKHLVTTAQGMGFKVIIDWVANHTGWDNTWIHQHPEWFTKDAKGKIIPPDPEWSDVADLNFDVPEMRAAMIDALKFWVAETGIDGYRCDVAWGVPTDFWNDARAALDSLKPVWMLAEDEDHKDFLVKAFNCNYSWSLHHKLNNIAQGKDSISAIKNWFAAADSIYPAGSYAMQFTSNHDENSWQGTEYERMGDAAKTFAALTFVIPGMPLIYSGQEATLNKRLLFFEKDQIDWSNLEMQEFYKKLVALKKENKALWNGAAGASAHFLHTVQNDPMLVIDRAVEGNRIVAIFNLSSTAITNSVGCPRIVGKYENVLTGEKVTCEKDQSFDLQAWEYLILKEE
jgi:1,4-alpha-glucan branching enzyme